MDLIRHMDFDILHLYMLILIRNRCQLYILEHLPFPVSGRKLVGYLSYLQGIYIQLHDCVQSSGRWKHMGWRISKDLRIDDPRKLELLDILSWRDNR